MLPETLVVITFKSSFFCESAYRALHIVHTFQVAAAVIGNTVYFNILVAEFNEIPSCNCCPLYCCHDFYTKNIITSCIITTLRNMHTGYTVAYATDGLSPSIVSFA